MRHFLVVLTVFSVFASVTLGEETTGPVATILEENAADLLAKLTNPTGDPGEGHVEEKITFSGKQAIKIIPMQRFCNLIPGWAYKIRETPKEGEYRYLRFAWKSDGLTGIMVQLHDETDWHIRYTAGIDKFGWGTKHVAEKPPAEWNVATVDLFKDFGEFEIHGIALTAFDGNAGYFDHIYFARSIDDLDRINAVGIKPGELKLTDEQIEKLWAKLDDPNASLAYKSFWILASGGDSVPAFLKSKLKTDDAPDDKTIRQWIEALNDDDFEIRERASTRLAKHRKLAEKLLREELDRTESAEAKVRLTALLEMPATDETDIRALQTRRLLKMLEK